MPEVAAGFRTLNKQSYDPDALTHIEDYLLVAEFEDESLRLAEHFLPIERADDRLMGYAVPQRCNMIFELRVGQALRAGAGASEAPEKIAERLREGIEEEIHPDSASTAAEIVTRSSPPAWTQSQFDLVTGDICTDEQAWRDCLRLYGSLIQEAREAWQLEKQPPGCAFRGLSLLLNSVCDWKDSRRKPQKVTRNNLLEFLRPSGLEARLVESCRDILAINEPRARLMLQAHELLTRFAARHKLVATADIARMEKELLRLRKQLDG